MKTSVTIGLWLLFMLVVARGDELAATASSYQFDLKDQYGHEWTLQDFGDRQVVAVVFMGTECPLMQLYGKRLAEIARQFRGDSVAIVGINSNRQDSITELLHFARKHGIEFPLLKDVGNAVADQFGAERTPEVFVLDQQRRLRFRGRIDDQYTYGVQRPKAEHNYLVDAIRALLDGSEIEPNRTEVVGCHIGRTSQPRPGAEVTYCDQISRILQNNCVACHRAGEIAPFELTNYDEVVGWAQMIEEVVREQRMPPWHANAEHGDFKNDVRLSDEEKTMIYQWVADGAPEGNPARLPEPRKFAVGWQIGEPDVVFRMDTKAFQVPARGVVSYQYFVVDTNFQEDKWVRMAECRPGNRAVVHHIIVGVRGEGEFGQGDGVHGNVQSEWITATAPGARPLMLPEGYAKLVPAGAQLVFQMHYTPNGSAQEDVSEVGLTFANPATVTHRVATLMAYDDDFRIPPGANNHRVQASFRFPRDATLLAMFPHMHLRGKSFRYVARYPDGQEEILLDVPAYDFNWQNAYELAQPKTIPAKTRLKCIAYFDNSEQNLANPDPTVSVSWGDQTWEEMMIGYFDVAIPREEF